MNKINSFNVAISTPTGVPVGSRDIVKYNKMVEILEHNHELAKTWLNPELPWVFTFLINRASFKGLDINIAITFGDLKMLLSPISCVIEINTNMYGYIKLALNKDDEELSIGKLAERLLTDKTLVNIFSRYNIFKDVKACFKPVEYIPVKENEYLDKLPEDLKLEVVEYHLLESYSICLIHVLLDGITITLPIEKYQKFYGSIKWDSIFGTNYTNEEKERIIKEVYNKYKGILINEDEFINDFELLIKDNPDSYSYYRDKYTDKVEQIVNGGSWLNLRDMLKIKH